MRPSDVIFFLSGLAALAHETIWARLLTRTLGSDAGAAAVVLSAMMAGLGLGARLGAPLAGRRARLRFGALETFIGAWAASSPWILARLEPVGPGALRALVAGIALLPPTLAMGATFPLMGRLTIGARADAGGRVAGFYGANTLGAAAGALLAPFVLMPWLGLYGGLVGSGLISVAAGLGAQALHPPERSSAPAAEQRPARLGALGAVTFLMGMSALALEVLLTRVLVEVTGASVYAFAIVLAVFLLGIGLGSREVAGRLERGARPRSWAFGASAVVPVLVPLGALLLSWRLGERDLFAPLANRLPEHGNAWTLWAAHAVLAGLALLPAAIAFGISLPAVAAAAVERGPGSVEDTLGRVYAANTAGALLGAAGAATWVLPALGPRAGVALALAPPLLAAALLARGRRAWLFSSAAAAATLGLVAFRSAPPSPGVRRLASAVGPHATASVEERASGGSAPVRSLRVNGKVVATSAPVDLRLQRLLGLIPALQHGRVERALVIGLGTGMTAGALLDLDGLERLDVYEISPAVVAVAPAFADWNGGLFEDPRVHLCLTDGRYALARSSERWDLITSDPIHPWTRGSSDLYSLEHFQSVARHLAPGGVASQWLPLYQLSTADVRTIVATWLAAFPHASAWLTAYDLALVGSLAPPVPEHLRQPFPARVAADLAACGLHGPLELAALEVADRARLEAFAAGAAPMRDARPVLEFRAPKSYLAGYSTEALAWAAEPSFVARLPAAARPRALEVRALCARFLDELPQGYAVAAEHYGKRLLALPPIESSGARGGG